MKNKLFIFIVMVFFTAVSGPGWAIANPAIRNPVGFRALPPSSIRSGLVRSPNPIDTSGNLLITGNISGGRHFRGIVPYRASSYFGAETGSSSLDSFLRRSAGSEDFGRYSGTHKPFYSPSRTVTTTRPGWAGVIRPPTAKIGGRAAGSGAIAALLSPSKKQTLSYHDTGMLEGRYRSVDSARFQMQEHLLWAPAVGSEMRTRRPMSMTLGEMERAILAGVSAPIYQDKDRMPAHKETTARQETWMEQFRRELEQVGKRDTALGKGLTGQDEALRLRSSADRERNILQPFELERLRGQPAEDKQRDPERYEEQRTELDVYEQMEQQIDELQRSYEQLMAAEAAERAPGAMKSIWDGSRFATYGKTAAELKVAGDGEKVSSEEGSGFSDSVSAKSGQVELDSSDVDALISGLGKLGWPGSGRGISSEVRTSDVMRSSSGVELSARAKAILGPYKSFASFWDGKFNQHVAAGEKYLKEGKFYRSADAYTLALVYKPEEPLAYLGKSHALFAAGEYMSSALFLSRAIIAVSEGRETKDYYEVQELLALGSKFLAYIDRDKLENRVVDVEQWQQRSNSAELQFLLGYIYYQMGRVDAARKAIDGAYEKMSEAPAVVALKKIIDSEKRLHQD